MLKHLRVILGFAALLTLSALVFLGLRLKETYDEYEHWKTREATLENELDELRQEVQDHKVFLDRLMRDPEFQDATARKELGFGKPSEMHFRFPEELRGNGGATSVDQTRPKTERTD
jgi:cell division protein FtsB